MTDLISSLIGLVVLTGYVLLLAWLAGGAE